MNHLIDIKASCTAEDHILGHEQASSGNQNSWMITKLTFSGDKYYVFDYEKAMSEVVSNTKHPESDFEKALSVTDDPEFSTLLHGGNGVPELLMHVLEIDKIGLLALLSAAGTNLPLREFL